MGVTTSGYQQMYNPSTAARLASAEFVVALHDAGRPVDVDVYRSALQELRRAATHGGRCRSREAARLGEKLEQCPGNSRVRRDVEPAGHPETRGTIRLRQPMAEALRKIGGR